MGGFIRLLYMYYYGIPKRINHYTSGLTNSTSVWIKTESKSTLQAALDVWR